MVKRHEGWLGLLLRSVALENLERKIKNHSYISTVVSCTDVTNNSATLGFAWCTLSLPKDPVYTRPSICIFTCIAMTVLGFRVWGG